ncbi:MAG: tRNA lysidine(34) synthetase TilS, partial [Bacteroidetes bacterium]|nr:tRNA lysidine(34) synthetase TilS [Bacteroidota bacterium]
TAKDKLLLAISGGLDSMVMLHLFQQCGFQFAVAHVNFQLRGEESEGDEQFLKEVCQKNSIEFFSQKVDTQAHADQTGESIQMAARTLRYNWFQALANEHHFDYITTAHHANDSLETMLLNLVRGSGLEGLDGITAKNGKIIRPLLFASRETIEKYAKENAIVWREDRSNASDDYQRNFLRHQVVPLLKKLNPSLENSFRESANKISGGVALLHFGIDQWKQKFEVRVNGLIRWKKEGITRFENPGGVLWNLAKTYGFNADQCEQAVQVIGETGKRFLSGSHELIIDRSELILLPVQTDSGNVVIEATDTHVERGDNQLKILVTKNSGHGRDPLIAELDRDKITFPITWRSWKAGDAFHPLGMSHHKKVSDFLVDEKVSLADKKNVSVLESAGEIIWIVGYRIDDQFKISDQTVSKISFQLSVEK